MSKEYNLEPRLITFAVRNIKTAERLPGTRVGNHIRGQLIRCRTSPAPNYGEAQSAESRSDFIHKIKVVLNEPRETRGWLLMISKAGLIGDEELADTIRANEELVSIFVRSAQTARTNKRKPS